MDELVAVVEAVFVEPVRYMQTETHSKLSLETNFSL